MSALPRYCGMSTHHSVTETKLNKPTNLGSRASKQSDSLATTPSSVSSILFTSHNFSISGQPENNGSSELGDSGPFDDARETERRRAPHPPQDEDGPRARRSRRGDKVAYVVFHGRELGVFYNWEACERSVIRFSGQRYKGYYTKQEAVDAWNHANAVGNIGPVSAAAAPAGPSTHTNFSHLLSDEEAYWAVLQGLSPGVYHGLRAARNATGKTIERAVVVRALTKDEACRAFTKSYMKGRVVVLAPHTRQP